jgi:hypothetical protein
LFGGHGAAVVPAICRVVEAERRHLTQEGRSALERRALRWQSSDPGEVAAREGGEDA